MNEGANAILVSCSDAGKLTGAIDDAVARGVPVMTFDSDAPKSKRFAYYGVDDCRVGEQVMAELAKQLDGKGKVAILAGNQNAPNLRRRVDGIKAEAAKSKGIQIVGTFYHNETPQDAAAEVIRVNNAYPGIRGWAMAGGWALYTKTLLTDLDPKKIKLVAVDALPPELPYVEKGLAPVLLAQSSYLWGNVGGHQDHRQALLQEGRPRDHPDGSGAGHHRQPRLVGAPAPPVGLPRRPRGIPEAEVGAPWTTPRSSRFGGVEQALPRRARAGGGQLRHRARAPATRSAARTAPGRARSASCWRGSTPRRAARSCSTASRSGSTARATRSRAGVGMVHQELAFCENLSVAENLCLGALPRARAVRRSPGGGAARRAQLLEAIEATIDVHRLVGELTVAEQQVVQIAAAVGSGARVIIFDEPTSSLSQQEADHLYALMGRLRERGVTCVYVSHRMPEIFRLCDTITVLRDGRHVTTQPTRALDEAALVELMIGRRLDQYLPKQTARAPGEVILRVDKLSSPGKFHDVSFEVRAGEIVGLAGLVGAGRSDVAQGDLRPGRRRRGAGRGRRAAARRLARPSRRCAPGSGLVPEDRKRQGFIPELTGIENLALPILPQLARWGWLPRRRGARARRGGVPAPQHARRRTSTPPTVGLSGGNQQKIVFAKWLAARCRLLILDEPTRGVDVGAKAEIHSLIHDLAEAGTGDPAHLERAPRADRALDADVGAARRAAGRRAAARSRSGILDAPDGRDRSRRPLFPTRDLAQIAGVYSGILQERGPSTFPAYFLASFRAAKSSQACPESLYTNPSRRYGPRS